MQTNTPSNFTVLRCLVWIETTSSRQSEIELAGQQVDDGLEVSGRAVAACLCLGGLHQAVDALDQAIGDSAVEPPQDAMPMMFDGAAASIIGASRQWVAQKYHFFRKPAPASAEGWW